MTQPPPPDPLKLMMLRHRTLERKVLNLEREVAVFRFEKALGQAGRTPRFPIQFRAQFGEDLTLCDILGNPLDGFFIEVGANDGVDLSVSYAFEAIGWKGVLIEALPEQAENCRKVRPASRVVQAALSKPGSPKTTTFTLVEADSLMSFMGDLSAAQAAELANSPKKQITVPVTTMNDVLEGHTGPIDFASIDVEGAEIDLLKGFDLARFAPRVMLIEDTKLLNGVETGIVEYMAKHPYVLVSPVGVSRVFVHKSEQAILTRLRNAQFGRQ